MSLLSSQAKAALQASEQYQSSTNFKIRKYLKHFQPRLNHPAVGREAGDRDQQAMSSNADNFQRIYTCDRQPKTTDEWRRP